MFGERICPLGCGAVLGDEEYVRVQNHVQFMGRRLDELNNPANSKHVDWHNQIRRLELQIEIQSKTIGQMNDNINGLLRAYRRRDGNV